MLFQTEAGNKVLQSFQDQFQPDGQDYLYRKYQKGAPIRVSAEERDRFIAAFRRSWTFLVWMGAAIYVPSLIVLLIYVPAAAAHENMIIWSSMAIFLGLVVAGMYWYWNVPMRALRSRGTSGQALSPVEARRLAFSKISFGQLATVPVLAAVLLWRVGRRNDIWSGWGRLWLVPAVALIVLAAVQAFRKWRFESSDKR